MAFTVLSWNVEQFEGLADPNDHKIAQYIRKSNPDRPIDSMAQKYWPDIISIYEVKNSHQAFLFANKYFKKYLTFITDGPNNQEIMILIKEDKFNHITVTQKHKFKIDNPYLRPGALVTVTKNNLHTNLLFLHSKSGIKADAFGDRFEITKHIFNLNKHLQRIQEDSGLEARLIILGDLNTMGLKFPKSLVAHEIQSNEDEINGLAYLAEKAYRSGFNGMKFAIKKHDLTFSNKNDRLQSNLDHVLISDGIQLDDLGTRPSDSLPFQVSVNGWIDKPTVALRNQFIADYSDHCSLFLKVQ